MALKRIILRKYRNPFGFVIYYFLTKMAKRKAVSPELAFEENGMMIYTSL